MDFSFDETQGEIQALAASILDQATPARVGAAEVSPDGYDRELWQDLARADLLGIAMPPEVGGSGHGIMELCVLLQEVGRRVAPLPALPTLVLGALPIARFGSTEQRKRYLAGVLDGTSLLSGAIDEAGRHDPLAPATTATRDGSSWRLEGIKIGVSYAQLSERIVTTARTPDGPALFLVDPSSPGVTIEPCVGTQREPQGHLVLEGATVDDEDVFADPEAVPFLYRHAVAGLCAVAVGVLDEAVRITASYISQREQFGRPIATFQAATLKAADAYIDTEAARATVWSAIWRLATGRPCDEELAIGKFWVSEGGQNVVHHCQHLHGGMGVDTDYPIHRYFLWSKALELALGGATPQLLRIGAHVAGEA